MREPEAVERALNVDSATEDAPPNDPQPPSLESGHLIAFVFAAVFGGCIGLFYGIGSLTPIQMTVGLNWALLCRWRAAGGGRGFLRQMLRRREVELEACDERPRQDILDKTGSPGGETKILPGVAALAGGCAAGGIGFEIMTWVFKWTAPAPFYGALVVFITAGTWLFLKLTKGL